MEASVSPTPLWEDRGGPSIPSYLPGGASPHLPHPSPLRLPPLLPHLPAHHKGGKRTAWRFTVFTSLRVSIKCFLRQKRTYEDLLKITPAPNKAVPPGT